jgi:hypothetical protein
MSLFFFRKLPMLKKIICGYKTLFFSMAKIAVILLICIGLGTAVVWPLWKFATAKPDLYTLFILCCAGIVFFRFLFLKICRTSRIKLLSYAAQILILSGACLACIYSILNGHRFLTIPILAGAFVLFGICRFGLRNK